MPRHFIISKLLLVTAYKVTDKLQNWCISLPIAIVTVPVYHSCTYVANWAWAHDVHLSCVVCSQVQVYTPKLYAQYMCIIYYEVLHMIKVQAHMCTHTSA